MLPFQSLQNKTDSLPKDFLNTPGTADTELTDTLSLLWIYGLLLKSQWR